MERHTAITGLGAVTSLGLSLEETWQGLVAGRSGVAAIDGWDASAFPTRIAAQVRGLDPLAFVEDRKALRTMDKHTFMAVAAVAQALADAGLGRGEPAPPRLGLYLGLGMVDYDVEDIAEAARLSRSSQGVFDWEQFAREGYQRIYPLWTIEMLPNIALCQVAILNNVQGANLSLGSFGEAGAYAVGEGLRAVQAGDVDVAVAGGVSFKINPFSLARFSLMGMLSQNNDQPTQACRPFDADRDGTVLGEGAAVVVLEEKSHALDRRCPIYGEVAGYGAGSGSQGNWGVGPMRAMQAALADAGLAPDEVDYLCADAAALVDADREEAWAIREVFGPRASSLPVSAVKSMVGHTMAASGPLGLAIASLVLQRGVMPPTANYTRSDPACPVNCIPMQTRTASARTALVNARGLDGVAASLVVRRDTG